ncbi:MAG: complex I NDUFA9 subunit family protein [Deltaproteobacteria bacterium]|nr:complex I NDUFA9 subunit family protein [Deltaproteobacteria bacterium]MDH3382524.1 complex I NDUFA9 subunit family protein [Deltaproteobacteria bacterium]
MEKVPFLNYREVLVTGGTGFLGRHVCRALIARGYLPRLLVRVGSEGRIPEDIRRASRVTPGDVTNREFVEMAAQSTEAIVHLAGIIREFPARGVTFEKVHVEATRNAVHAAKRWGISRFVYVSALGASPSGPGKYFESKGKAEEIVRQSGLSWTIFRPSGIVGPGDQFFSELGRAVRRAPFLPVPGDGEFLLQPVFVGDVVKGITDCLKRPDTERRVFEVGGPERITYNALIDRIAAVLGVRVRKVHISLPRFRRIVGFFSRFEKFPLAPDMLEVLLAGTTCERDPFYSTFGLDPLPLAVSLESMRGTSASAGEVTQAERSGISPGKRKKDSSSRKAA